MPKGLDYLPPARRPKWNGVMIASSISVLGPGVCIVLLYLAATMINHVGKGGWNSWQARELRLPGAALVLVLLELACMTQWAIAVTFLVLIAFSIAIFAAAKLFLGYLGFSNTDAEQYLDALVWLAIVIPLHLWWLVVLLREKRRSNSN